MRYRESTPSLLQLGLSVGLIERQYHRLTYAPGRAFRVLHHPQAIPVERQSMNLQAFI